MGRVATFILYTQVLESKFSADLSMVGWGYRPSPRLTIFSSEIPAGVHASATSRGTISEILATEMLFYRIQIVAHYERGIAPGTNSLYLTEIEFLPALGTFQTIEI